MKKGVGMRITKVYTKKGDKGKTRLAGGQQLWKDDVQVEAYEDMGELNSTIGVVRAFNAELVGIHPSADRLEEDLRWVQNKLFKWVDCWPRHPGRRSRICQRSQHGT